MKQVPRDIRRKFASSKAEIRPRFKKELENKLFKENIMAKKKNSSAKRFFAFARTTPALAVLAALVIVGGSSALVATDRANVAHDAEIEVPSSLDGLKTIDEIRDIALTDMPSGEIVSVELEKEDGKLLYKVKFADGTVRFYNATSGAAIVKDSSEEDGSVPANFVAALSLQEARTIAQDQRPGKVITKIELESEDGVVVYSVRFSDGGRVDVNATDGSVMRVRGASNSGSNSSGSDSDEEDENDEDEIEDEDEDEDEDEEDADDEQDDEEDDN